ncbi:transporter [Altericroceibacterium endophyticum]|uniref:Transporter n=1 Tax=Altericroceibacterium endophyticum TaxID=1808508 RepID=A0A6I4T5A2_9SPHN|nr:transporter [Altericroceibacterium endophyticum]MXO66066.1 hypothetical protein [Altericroceibacterium endophyticum]
MISPQKLLRSSPLALIGCALCLAGPAHAQSESAFPTAEMKDRDNQIIASFYYSDSKKGFDADGNSVDIADYHKRELYLLAEVKATEELTLILAPSFRDVSADGSDNDTTGLGYTEVGARYRVLDQDGWSLAFQGTVRIPGEERDDFVAQLVSTATEYDMRLRLIHGFAVGEDSGFFDVQAGYRLLDGALANEFHLDLTAGYRPVPDILLLAQTFSTVSDGSSDISGGKYRYHNLQISAVKDLSESVSLQAGVTGTLAGENALRERGFFGGLWVRF